MLYSHHQRKVKRVLAKLVITACSQRKRLTHDPLPAIERYDGPTFQLIRRFLRTSDAASAVDIYILSAKYGLVTDDTLIPYYNQKMMPSQVASMAPIILSQLRQIFNTQSYDSLFITAGKSYLQSLQGMENIIPSSMSVKIARGSPGNHLSALHDWLYDEIPGEKATKKKGSACFKGIHLELAPWEIYQCAKEALAVEAVAVKARSYQSWYVAIDGIPVAPKWLVSRLSGVPVGQFHTDEARRVLETLGIKVERA
jgi:hypothetical protein